MSGITVRAVRESDYAGWRPLWDGYNAFYGRQGKTALPESITATTWERFLDPREPVHALVAMSEGEIVGLAHYLFHRSTSRLTDVCYLQDRTARAVYEKLARYNGFIVYTREL